MCIPIYWVYCAYLQVIFWMTVILRLLLGGDVSGNFFDLTGLHSISHVFTNQTPTASEIFCSLHTHCKHILWAYMMDLCVYPSVFVHGFHIRQADVMSCNVLNMLKWRGSAVIKLFTYAIFGLLWTLFSEHFIVLTPI